MIFHLEIEDSVVDAVRNEQDATRRLHAEMALLAAVDREIEDLRRTIQDHVLGNVKEPV